MYGERDLGFHWGWAEQIFSLAAESSVIVAGIGPKNVDVSRFTSIRFVIVIDLLFVLVPDDFRQRIASA